MAALDARKTFDRVDPVKLFNLLLDNNVFSSVISVHSLSVRLSVFSILCWLPQWRINVFIITILEMVQSTYFSSVRTK